MNFWDRVTECGWLLRPSHSRVRKGPRPEAPDTVDALVLPWRAGSGCGTRDAGVGAGSGVTLSRKTFFRPKEPVINFLYVVNTTHSTRLLHLSFSLRLPLPVPGHRGRRHWGKEERRPPHRGDGPLQGRGLRVDGSRDGDSAAGPPGPVSTGDALRLAVLNQSPNWNERVFNLVRVKKQYIL